MNSILRLWGWIEHLLPHQTHHGGRGIPGRIITPSSTASSGSCTPAPWRDVPERYGPWQTVYDRFNRWRKDGTWSRIVTRLLDHLDRHGRLGRDLWCVDGTIIRATRAAAGARRTPGRRRMLAGGRRRNSSSRLTMRWATRGAASGPRSICCATVMASSWAST